MLIFFFSPEHPILLSRFLEKIENLRKDWDYNRSNVNTVTHQSKKYIIDKGRTFNRGFSFGKK